MLEKPKNETDNSINGSYANQSRPEHGKHGNRNVRRAAPLEAIINGFLAFLHCMDTIFSYIRERCCSCCPPNERAFIPSSHQSFHTSGRSRYNSFSKEDGDTVDTSTVFPSESTPERYQEDPASIPMAAENAASIIPDTSGSAALTDSTTKKQSQSITTAIVHTIPEHFRITSNIPSPDSQSENSMDQPADLPVDEALTTTVLSPLLLPALPSTDTSPAASTIKEDTSHSDQAKGSLILPDLPPSVKARQETDKDADIPSQVGNDSIPAESSLTLTVASKKTSEDDRSLDEHDEKPDATFYPAEQVTLGSVCQVHSIEDSHDMESDDPTIPAMTPADMSTEQFGQVLLPGATGTEESLNSLSFSLAPDTPMCLTLGTESLMVQSVEEVENYLNSLSDSFSDESTELLSEFDQATRIDMAKCNADAIGELETLIMEQCKDLTLQSSDDAWNTFVQAIYDKCQSMISPHVPEQSTWGTFYSYLWGTPEPDPIHVNFHLIAYVAHVLNGFPDYKTELSTQFEHQHPEDLYPFRRKVIACMNVILQHLDLENRFKAAVAHHAKPIHIRIENGQDTTGQVSPDEIKEIVEKIKFAINHQVSGEQQKDDNLVTYENMQLPGQFLEKDLGRMHYQFNLENDQKVNLPAQYKGTLDEKKQRAFHALCQLTGNNEEAIRQICFYATQDAHIGLLRAMEFNFIWRIFGPGFRFSGHDAIIKLSKNVASGNIVITYEFTRQPVSLLTHNFGNIVTMENLREGWDQALVRCEISIMIDPSDAKKPPTYLPLKADIDLP